MIAKDLIYKKACGQELSAAECQAFFTQVAPQDALEYQTAAMLTAIFIQGLSAREVYDLTRVMVESGRRFEWPFPRTQVVDKHSTGGVGDKTSLILLPLVTLLDLKIPMISGRSLGHTGGTVDKLEAIPGMSLRLSYDKMLEQMKTLGGFFGEAGADLAPLDRKLYALRDAIGMVSSIPLITSSILSKKIAEGIGNLVLDLKWGSGAFLPPTVTQKFAQTIQETAALFDLPMRILITNMDVPLGEYCGNILEVHECIEVMKGHGPEDVRELTLDLVLELQALAFPHVADTELRQRAREMLASGKVYEQFCRLVRTQGGSTDFFAKEKNFFSCTLRHEVLAPAPGFMGPMNVRELGTAINVLGGGRLSLQDKVDHQVGLQCHAKTGKKLQKGEPLFTLWANDARKLQNALSIIEKAFLVVPEAPQVHGLVLQRK